MRYLLTLLIMLCIGCGGGSSGTDGGVTLRVLGTVTSTNGALLSGLEVTAVESGDSVSTSQQGSFDLRTSIERDSVTLLVRQGDKETTLTPLTGVQNGDIITLNLKLDETNFSISVVSLSITPLGANDPTPTPSNSNNPKATPTPRIEQQDIVTGTIRTANGRPVDKLSISVKNTSIRGKSDRNGNFVLRGQLPRSGVTLIIANQAFKREVVLPTLPETPVVIKLKLLFVVSQSGQIDPSVAEQRAGFEISIKSLTLS